MKQTRAERSRPLPPERSGGARVPCGAITGGALLIALGWGSGCSSSNSGFELPPIPRRTCGFAAPHCDQTCRDNNVAYALYNAGWLLYNQDVVGTPIGAVSKTAACPLGGTVTIAGSTSGSGNGPFGTDLTFTLTDCGISATTYALTFSGTLQMNGTYTPMAEDAITFSSTNLNILGALAVLDKPNVDESCPVSITDTWNYQPNELGWLNGEVCARSADGTDLYPPESVYPLDWRCLLESMQLKEGGKAVEFSDVPDSALATDSTPSTPDSTAPELTNAPAPLTFASGAPQPLDLDFSDPTASRPAFFVTVRPPGGKLECATPCCWGCRATHRVFDKQTAGVAHYETTTAADPIVTGTAELAAYPVSCAEAGLDPVSDAGCTPLIGTPLEGVGITFDAPPSAGPSPSGGSSGSGGSGGGSSSGGGPSGDGLCGTVCGDNPGAPNNAGVCGTDGLCHCCYDTCGVDQAGTVSGCACVGCSSNSDCTQLAFPTCVHGFCITAQASTTKCQ